MKEIRKIIRAYDNTNHNEVKVALAAVVNVEESSYRRIGARMLVQSNGIWTGGISGGCLEGDALKRAQKAIYNNSPSKVVYDTMDDDKNQIGVGLGCNGRIEILFTPIDPADASNEIELLRKIQDDTVPNILLKIIGAEQKELVGRTLLLQSTEITEDFAGIKADELKESIRHTLNRKRPMTFEHDTSEGTARLLVEFIKPETRLIIVGDNYDIHAMLGISQQLGWRITVVGKAKKLPKSVYQIAEQVVDYSQAAELDVNDYTAIVLMSHDYNHDKKLLPIFIDKKPGYIGMLGPKKRFIKMQNDLDTDLSEIDYLFSPTGLEIGAESPEEIALSITAEIVAKFRNKSGSSLRLKEGTIHDRV